MGQIQSIAAMDAYMNGLGTSVNTNTVPSDLAAIVQANQSESGFDMDYNTWFAQRADKPPQKVGVLGNNGEQIMVIGTIQSVQDIYNATEKMGMVRKHGISALNTPLSSVYNAAVAYNHPSYGFPLIPPAPQLAVPPAPVVAPTAPIPQAAPVQVSPQPTTQPQVQLPQDFKPIIKEKRVPDFKPIKMDWLGAKPNEPTILAHFESENGEFETYYHAMFPSEAVFYFIWDKRCKSGRFIPKINNGLATVTIDKKQYVGTLWPAAKFELGVLEITPFVLAPEDFEEEEEQTNY